MPTLKPFLLERHIAPRVWGGRALEQMFGLRLPPGTAVGETWELFDRPEGSSRIRGRRRTLADLMRDHREDLLGSTAAAAAPGGRFPVLLKFLDAREALSVQVHPDDEQARSEHDSGKSEAWVVLRAGRRARIILGLRPGVRLAEFRKVAHTAAVRGLLRRWKPRVGDAIDVPAGTVHSVGPDVVLFEVQENSDITYRLYDWGRPRELQVEKALAVVRAGPARKGRLATKPVPLADGGALLLSTPHFRIVRHDLRRPLALAGGGAWRAVTAIGGAGELRFRDGRSTGRLPLAAGDTALVPACTAGFELRPAKRLAVLITHPGER